VNSLSPTKRTSVLLYFVVLVSSVIAGCASESEPIEGNADCVAPLVRLQTGSDSSCEGGKEHAWPVGMAADDCHGWRATDTTGSEHDNSANSIQCNADGSFQFTQYPGTLKCEGTGTVKVYTADTCEQDTPPTLYTVAVDLSCCTDPDSAACTVGRPSVGVDGAQITLNGEACAP
jgi:hypothetical protein